MCNVHQNTNVHQLIVGLENVQSHENVRIQYRTIKYEFRIYRNQALCGPLHLGPFAFNKIVPSKSSNSATGPKKALKCVQTFSHSFSIPTAQSLHLQRRSLYFNFCRDSRNGRSQSVTETFPRTSHSDVLIGWIPTAGWWWVFVASEFQLIKSRCILVLPFYRRSTIFNIKHSVYNEALKI